MGIRCWQRRRSGGGAAHGLCGASRFFEAGLFHKKSNNGIVRHDGCLDDSRTNNYRNTSLLGSISLSSATSLLSSPGPDNLVTGDFDGDGKPDLAVLNGSTDVVSLFRATGSPGTLAFAPKADFSVSRFPAFVGVGDLDGDGKPDLAVLNNGMNSLSLLRNTSTTGTISFAAKLDVSAATGSICGIGDFDGDSRPDLIINAQSAGSVAILRNAIPQPPIITAQPQSQVVPWGANVLLTAAADGSPPLAYQWFVTHTNFLDATRLEGETNTSLSLSNITQFSSGKYFVVVTNAYGAATSSLAQVTVKGFIQSQIDAAAPNDLILIPAGTYSENVRVTKPVRLQGSGANVTIVDGGGGGSVFTINPGVLEATISDLTITNGNNQSSNGGGGVLNLGQWLEIRNSLIVGNKATRGGGIYNGSQGFLKVHGSSISANSADVGGGAWNEANLFLYDTTLDSNIAGTGGGIYSQNPFGVLQAVGLYRCTVSRNSATNGNGGGIFNSQGGIAELMSCTIAFNSAFGVIPGAGNGGGVFNDGYRLDSKSTIYADNSANNGMGRDYEGSFSSDGHNLIEFSNLSTTDPTDLLGIDPLLGPLQANGGPTFTHALLQGSPAIDSGDSSDATDQRQFPRISDGNGDGIAVADIGAYEYQNTPPGITAFYDIQGFEDVPPAPILFSIWDYETPATNLVVSAHSSNPGLVPDTNLLLQGGNETRSLTVIPLTDLFGAATISVTISDGQLSTTNQFVVNFASVNDSPTISAVTDRAMGQNTSLTIPLFVGDVETPAGSLTLQGSSSDAGLLPPGNIVFGGASSNRTVQVTPATNRSGSVTVTLAVTDADGASASSSFALNVQAPPQITIQPLNRTGTNGATISFSVTATGEALSYQWFFNSTNLLAGATNSIVLLTNISTASVGTYAAVVANLGGSVTSSPALLRITTLPFISSIPNQVTVAGLATPTIPFTIGDLETPATNLALSASSSVPVLVPTNNIVFGGSGSKRTVTVTPLTNVTGAASIQVTVTDMDGGTASSGFVLTVGSPLSILQQPLDSLVVTQGYDASLSIIADGYGALTYQWRRNGTNIIGATSGTLNLYNVQANQAGGYSVVVGYDFGSITSTVSTLTVSLPPSPISSQLQQIALYAGWNLISFQVGLDGYSIAEILNALDRTNALLEIWGYDAATRSWRTYQAANPHYIPPLALDRLYAGVGYWVRVSQSAVLRLQGYPWTGQNLLAPGWNLVGFPGLAPDQTELLGLESIFRDSLSRVPRVWTYDTSVQRFKGYDSLAYPALAELTTVEPGRGYWVYSLDGMVFASDPVIALPQDTDVSPLQTQQLFESNLAHFRGDNPQVYAGRMVLFTGPEDDGAGVDFNNNGILDDAVTQDTLFFDEGVRAQPISILNNGTGLINWAIDSRVPWLTFDATSGVTGTEVDSVSVYVDRTGLVPGIYSNAMFVVQAGNLVKYVKVIMKVPTVVGDYRGGATTTRVNGKPISLGMVDLNLSMYADAGDIYHTPTFRAVINRDKALLFPRDVFMNGVFYQGNSFSLTTSFEVPAGDRNAPPYTTFSHATNQVYGDRDWNRNRILDNQNPFPFAIRREVTLLGRRTTPDHLQGTYVEAISGILPAPQRIYIEGTFALDRESLTPAPKSIYSARSTNNPVVIGGSSAGSYTNTLTVPSPINIQGVRVIVNLGYSTLSQLEVLLFSPSGRQVTLHRVGADMAVRRICPSRLASASWPCPGSMPSH